MKQGQKVVEQKPIAHVLLRSDGSAHSFFYMKDLPQSLLERTSLKVLHLCACNTETTTLLDEQTILDAKRWQMLMLAFENELKGSLEVNSAPVGYDSAKLMWVEFGVQAPKGEKPTVDLFTAGVDKAISSLSEDGIDHAQ